MEDGLALFRPERILRDEVDPSAEHLLKIVADTHEVEDSHGPVEVDKKVDVTRRLRLASCYRTEELKRANAQVGSQDWANGSQG